MYVKSLTDFFRGALFMLTWGERLTCVRADQNAAGRYP